MLKFPADTRQFFFSHARTALKYGLLSLGIKPGDEILIPDYICNVVLHPLDQLGIKVKYYSLENDLTPQWNMLEKLVTDRTRAVLMVHFFGQPQDILKFQEFSKKRGLFLIEDNAHGHGGSYNGQLLGTFGDVGIASPRKFHNMLSGGILFLNDLNLSGPNTAQLETFHVTAARKVFKILTDNFPGVKQYLKYKLKRRPAFEDPFSFQESPIGDYLIDPISLRDYKKIDWYNMAAIKRKNYSVLEETLKDQNLEPVFNAVHPETAPQCFPVYAESKEKAKQWFAWGWKNGYHVYSWPALPKEIIKEGKSAFRRWETLICFSTERVFTKL